MLYIQLFFSVFIFAGSQLLPRLIDTTRLESTRIETARWIYLYPPAWVAAPLDLLAGHVHRPQIVLTLIACIVPPLAFMLVVRGLAARFHHMLAAMESGESVQHPALSTQPNLQATQHSALGTQHFLPFPLSRLMSSCPTFRSAFELFWTILSRDRLFKQRVYPSAAMLFIIPLGILLSDHRGLRVVVHELPSTNRHLFVLYLAAASFAPAILQLRYSAFWQAAWIYETPPIARPGELLAAALAVVFMRFILPAFALLERGCWCTSGDRASCRT